MGILRSAERKPLMANKCFAQLLKPVFITMMLIRFLKILGRYLAILGFDPLRTVRALRGAPAYFADYLELKRQRPAEDTFAYGKLYPCLGDRFATSGDAKGHYFHQDLLVASRIFKNNPTQHIDVGSRVDGFVAHVASYRRISVVDIRPLTNRIRNIDFLQADLMSELPRSLVASCDSLSCLHALEHFGLGRYGDTVQWNGYSVGFDNLIAMIKPGGKFYFSVPIGPQRIEFNAHRVFAIEFLLKMFFGRLQLDEFSYVDDRGDLHESIELDEHTIAGNCGCSLGCGIFELTKLA
jgi:Caenorhabditis protein of unknown function, DUF268